MLAECWAILGKYVFESVFCSNLLFNKLGLALLVVAKSCLCVQNNIIRLLLMSLITNMHTSENRSMFKTSRHYRLL